MKKQPKVKPEKVNKVLAVVEKTMPGMTIAVIKDGNDFNHAVEVLSQLNRRLDEVTAEKEKVTKPLNEALRAERARFKPYEDKLLGAIDAIRKAMSTYQTRLLQLQKSTAEKAAKDVSSGKVTIDTAVRMMDTHKAITGTVSTSSGAVQFRTDKVVRITDVTILPKSYMMPDVVEIKRSLMSGVRVPGAVLEEVQTVVNRR